jgi:hypothetical protein
VTLLFPRNARCQTLSFFFCLAAASQAVGPHTQQAILGPFIDYIGKKKGSEGGWCTTKGGHQVTKKKNTLTI